MPTKRILVLANSIKKGNRCVAGRELLLATDGTEVLGPWIRPVDLRQHEGAILTATTVLGGRVLTPLDVVEIDFDANANNPLHPEDWNITQTSPWRMIRRENPAIVGQLPCEAGDLWGASTASSRRVAPTGGIPTLRLIKPTGRVVVEAYRDQTHWGTKYRRFLKIDHLGATHVFSIDDPEFCTRHHLDHLGDGRIVFELTSARTAVVASLTPPFEKDGQHYKIAATIFES
jgi:hypothetical protein